MPKPSCAPAWLYVPIPEGSSSEAPVIRPGPSRLRKPLSASVVFFFFVTADLSQIRHTNGRKGNPVPRLTFSNTPHAPEHDRHSEPGDRCQREGTRGGITC